MKKILFALPLLFLAQVVFAADLSVKVANAWARPTIGTNNETAVYLDIKNSGNASITLTRVSSPSGAASMHESMAHDGMMSMTSLESAEIKPGETLSFEPGHKHIMLEQLKTPLKEGDKIELSLFFEGGSTKIIVPVSYNPVTGEAQKTP